MSVLRSTGVGMLGGSVAAEALVLVPWLIGGADSYEIGDSILWMGVFGLIIGGAGGLASGLAPGGRRRSD